MSTPIERFLFRDYGTHAVVAFALVPDKLLLTLAPWVDLTNTIKAEFREFKITSLDLYPDTPADLNLPWDIIGFDSNPLEENRWTFCLHCDSIEYGFESLWPVLLA